jgi:signal transduction histidine kinase
MIGPKLFRRYFAMAAFLMLALFALGTVATRALLRLVPNEHARPVPMLIARVLQHIDPQDPVHGLQVLREWYPQLRSDVMILDENGKPLSPGLPIPGIEEDLKRLSPGHDALWIDRDHDRAPDESLILLSENPRRYLHARLSGSRDHAPWTMGLTAMAFQLLAVLLGMGISLYFLFQSLRAKAVQAQEVLNELQKGNLKARFPITRMDELGQAMSRFNQMADEIERLVERLRTTERSRMSLLSELAHDLRTPIASLKNLVATVQKRSGPQDEATRSELLTLAGREVEYFEELVEDLLVLAQISEPRYQANREPVSLIELLEEEVEGVAAQYEGQGKEIRIERQSGLDEVQLSGDSRLLHRMIRNALDNAVSFARREVVLRIRPESQEILLSVEDDGPGMSDEAIRAFGERRVSRMLGASRNGRLSVGLGSVIMKTIAQLHRGTLHAGNRAGGSGARIEIRLPLTVS